MNITQRMYFGQFPLDKDRDRRIVFYGRLRMLSVFSGCVAL